MSRLLISLLVFLALSLMTIAQGGPCTNDWNCVVKDSANKHLQQAHFVKYTEADEKNKHSWMNTVRTKLTFADKFTKIPAAGGSRINTRYTLNLTNGNWLEKELDHLDRNDFFADSGLVEPKVWDQMRRGELGLPEPTDTPRSSNPQRGFQQPMSVRQPPAVSSPQPFLDFDNIAIEDFDAAKMLGLS